MREIRAKQFLILTFLQAEYLKKKVFNFYSKLVR